MITEYLKTINIPLFLLFCTVINGLKFATPLVVGIIFEFLISKVIILILGIEPSDNPIYFQCTFITRLYYFLQYIGLENVEQSSDFSDEYSNAQITETIVNSYITWGVSAFDEVNTELLKFFSYHGYELKQGTKEMYQEALVYSEDMPEWPCSGSIVDKGEYIIVNF